MARFTRSAALLTVLAGVVVAAVAAAPTDPPFPLRINFPAPTVNPTTGAVTANFSPESIAVAPGTTTFYCPNTTTGGMAKGDFVTGVMDPNWIPASPASPDPAHRSALGNIVDSHNRLWMAGNLGATGGTTAKGTLFVFDATTGVELAAYKITDAVSKTMNDMVVTDTAVWVSDTSAPSGAGSEVQHKLTLGPGGSLPPGGEINPDGTPNPSVPAPVIDVPTPGFVSSDGIDVLPNGNILFTSVSGNNGSMIVVNANTLAVTPVAVTTPNEPERSAIAGLPPLLSGDGVALDGNMLYYPENRTDVATCPAPNATVACPGDIAAVRLIPPNYTTAEVVARLNSPAGSGLPPLRSPANMEQLGNRLYVVSREVLPNPVTGAVNVTQTFMEQLAKLSTASVGTRVVANKEQLFSGEVAAVVDPAAAYTAYSATINWGDGTPATAGVVTPSGSRRLSVTGSHTYLTAGTVTVTTTVVGPNPAGAVVTMVTTSQATAVVPAAPPPPPPPLTTLNPTPVGITPVPTPTPVAATPVATIAAAVPVYRLTIKVTGGGTVSRTPTGASVKATRVAATSTTTILVSYKQGTNVKLVAKPNSKSKLGKWTGCSSAKGNTCQTGKLSAAKTIKVSFTSK